MPCDGSSDKTRLAQVYSVLYYKYRNMSVLRFLFVFAGREGAQE